MPLSLPRNAQLWLPALLSAQVRQAVAKRQPPFPADIFFCLADHYEPAHGGAPIDIQRARVAAWAAGYQRIADCTTDADGRPPRHTFFFPEEGYHPEWLDALAGLCERGFGEVEVHLHHDRDSSSALRDRLSRFTETLFRTHGLLRRSTDGHICYGFIHGNWALDNARPDGRWCGVNDEITVLRETGCYADFTLPAAPDPSQTRTINSIYYAVDDPHKPRSHDIGIHAAVGHAPPSNGLLIVQGPLTFDMRRRVWGVLPGLENGAIDSSDAHLPTLERFAAWVQTAVSIQGKPEWIFVKVHTHGAPESNAKVLLGPVMERFHSAINREFNDGERFRLHYVTAYEMATLIRAAELRLSGEPRDLMKQTLL